LDKYLSVSIEYCHLKFPKTMKISSKTRDCIFFIFPFCGYGNNPILSLVEKKDEKEMANKSVFAAAMGRLLPRTDVRNREGAPAFAYDARHKLAQLAVTGTFNTGFYAQAREQLGDAFEVCEGVSPEFLAQAAIYARSHAHMKDMPAFMLAVLSRRDSAVFARTFGRVIDNGRMLRNFVQIMRSGQTGRKSLGARPKAMVQRWLNEASDEQLLRASIGRDPSLADIIKMVHPKPRDARRDAFFAWLIGKPCNLALLPASVQDFIRFKETRKGGLPDVPFQMLTALELNKAQWRDIALRAGWQMMRMNLNTFTRHGVFEDVGVTRAIADRLRDAEAIRKARVFPYQLMSALTALDMKAPGMIRDALHDAMEIAVGNVPAIDGSVAVCPDVSGSMHSPVTGYRHGSTSVVRCVDVAALVTAAMLRRNPECRVLPFEHAVCSVRLEARDTVATNAKRLAFIGGGGTNCSAPLARLNRKRVAPDLVLIVSDNQSWIDDSNSRWNNGTETLRQWAILKRRNPDARMVCIDIAPYGTTQAQERDDILNVGGFSDSVFDVVSAFANGNMSADHWVGQIEGVEI
jgi:60 kDa SS-A/Ro ribonucleoprotein